MSNASTTSLQDIPYVLDKGAKGIMIDSHVWQVQAKQTKVQSPIEGKAEEHFKSDVSNNKTTIQAEKTAIQADNVNVHNCPNSVIQIGSNFQRNTKKHDSENIDKEHHAIYRPCFDEGVKNCANCRVLQTLRRKLEEEIQIHQAVTCSLREKVSAMEEKEEKDVREKNEMHETMKEFQTTNEQLEKEKTTLQESYEKKIAEAAELTEKCAEYEQNEENARAEITELKKKNDSQKNALGSSKRKCANQKKYIDTLEHKNEELTEENEVLRAQEHEKADELRQTDEQLEISREELQNSHEREARQRDEIDALNARLDQLQQIVNRLRQPQQERGINAMRQSLGQIPPEAGDATNTVLTVINDENMLPPD